MRSNGNAAPLAAEEFRTRFSSVGPLIREEWPQIDPVALDATDGELQRVVDLVANETEHTRTLVKRQLAELHEIAGEDSPAENFERVRKVLDDIQGKTSDMIDYVRKEMAEDAKLKVSDHPLVSLLIALGFGVVLGFLLRGAGGGR